MRIIKHIRILVLFAFILFLVCNVCWAKPYVGLQNQDGKKSFTSMEFNFFDNRPFDRYGYGSIQMLLGDISGIRIRSAGGMPLYTLGTVNKNVFVPMFLLDMGNTYVNWTKNDEIKDHYSLNQGLGIGMHSTIKKLKLNYVYKQGIAISNLYSRQFFEPNTRKFDGLQFSGSFGIIYFSREHIRIHHDIIDATNLGLRLGKNWGIHYREESYKLDKIYNIQAFIIKMDI